MTELLKALASHTEVGYHQNRCAMTPRGDASSLNHGGVRDLLQVNVYPPHESIAAMVVLLGKNCNAQSNATGIACIVQDLFAPATHVLMCSNDHVCLPPQEASIVVASDRAMLHMCGAFALLGGHVVSSCIGFRLTVPCCTRLGCLHVVLHVLCSCALKAMSPLV